MRAPWTPLTHSIISSENGYPGGAGHHPSTILRSGRIAQTTRWNNINGNGTPIWTALLMDFEQGCIPLGDVRGPGPDPASDPFTCPERLGRKSAYARVDDQHTKPARPRSSTPAQPIIRAPLKQVLRLRTAALVTAIMQQRSNQAEPLQRNQRGYCDPEIHLGPRDPGYRTVSTTRLGHPVIWCTMDELSSMVS